ncbi:hypothetical protein V7157_10485 [Neobacillus drentensis]|uniref:C1q-like domain-containing protein n=1 Tax=Neobacillus drentensis TaxID=220684 RepID=UPI003000D0C2
MSWQRLYNFQAGTKINSGQVNGEFNQLINAINTLDSTKETPTGAQTKATQALADSKTWAKGLPSILMTRATSIQAIAVSTMTKVIFNSIDSTLSVNSGGYNTTTGVFTVPEAGTYLINAGIQTDNISQNSAVELYLYRNNVQVCRLDKEVAPGLTSMNPSGSIVLVCAAGDSIDIRAFSNQAFNVNTGAISSITQLA